MAGYVRVVLMDDFRINRIHTSMMQPNLIGGVEKNLAIFNGMMAWVFFMGLEMPYMLLVSIGFHLFLMFLGKKDPQFRQVYMKYIKQAARYDTWPSVQSHRNKRPNEFGGDRLC